MAEGVETLRNIILFQTV